MKVGDTVFGLDDKHLWIVLTSPTPEGTVAVANLTTHDPVERTFCNPQCVVVHPGEHPYPKHDSCVHYQKAYMTDFKILRRGIERRLYRMNAPLAPALLERVRQGALDARMTSRDVKLAIRSDPLPP